MTYHDRAGLPYNFIHLLVFRYWAIMSCGFIDGWVLRLAPTEPCKAPPTPRRGSFGGKSDPTVPPKAPPVYGGS